MFINLNVFVTCFCLWGIRAVGDRLSDVVETERCWISSGDSGAVLVVTFPVTL
jgi:hypothetical protein